MFGKHPEFIVRKDEPFNGGPPPALIARAYVTPADLFFVRSHGNVPEVDGSGYRLEVTGRVPDSLSLRLDEIRSKFERVTLPATLQCAGNRREELIAARPIPHELPWGTEAISHAHWTGTRLRDVLRAAGLDRESDSGLHVEFVGLDETERKGERFHFGGSIPLQKALAGEVILAYEMNGEPLMPAHGYPLRAVVPGYIGARSVKWLSRIAVQDEASQNYFQRLAYRLFPPQIDANGVNWEKGMMLGEMNISSVITTPAPGARIPAGPVTVEGYAMAGGERRVARVDLSLDGGGTWIQAELDGQDEPWSWRLWRADVNLEPGEFEFVVRAVDGAANTQPPEISQVWNFKGYMNNAWHRVKAIVE